MELGILKNSTAYNKKLAIDNYPIFRYHIVRAPLLEVGAP